jgi:ABC-type dipeptide/oligopeptide/nickel transport system ATPase component/ABC-type dipeptide/oligopeptide/nickel transport system permease subunit
VSDTQQIASGHSKPIVRKSLVRRLAKNPLAVISSIYILGLIVAAIVAPWVAPFDPNTTDLSAVLLPADSTYLLGTDSAGRDILSRLLYGSQTTLLAAMIVIITSISFGVPTGLIAGYYGGKFDGVASWISNMLQSLPAIIILLAVASALGTSIVIAMFVFGILIAPGFFRLTRTAVMGVRNELYVDAARVSGLSDFRIIVRHILKVVRAPLIIQSAIISGIAISVQSGLEFLGLGDVNMVSWGVMLGEGFLNIWMSPNLMLWPALVISLTIAAFALLGNALRDALEDTQKIKVSARKLKRAKVSAKTTVNPKIEEADKHLLSVSGLSVGYAQGDGSLNLVVDSVSLHVDKGEVLGIVGESGSGKTQTAFSILGLLPDNAQIPQGHIVFDGIEMVSASGESISQKRMQELRGKRIAYIPQEPMSNLDPNFRVGYQLVRPLTKLLGISKREAKAKVLNLLDMVGIVNPERVFKAYPHEVSGGMAQRILIAGAISCEPDLLIADEPTTALDVTVQAEVLDLLRDLQTRLGMGMVLVTHNFGVVADLADKVVVMQYGKIVETGDVRTILRSPKHPYTQTLLSSMLEGKEPMTFLTSESKER